MDKLIKLDYVGSNSLLVVNPSGKLRRLFVPIAVKCVTEINIIRKGSTVFIEEIAEHYQHKIIYRVLGKWYPHKYFKF
jgi:hypothetical protein